MAALFKKSAYKADFIILFSVFAVSRAVLTWSGVHFNITPLYWFFQFLDPLYLKSDLLRSLLYLHSQPPGFNLFLGIVLKLFNGHELLVFKTIYLLIGLSMTILLYLVSRELKIPRMIALPVTIFPPYDRLAGDDLFQHKPADPSSGKLAFLYISGNLPAPRLMFFSV